MGNHEMASLPAMVLKNLLVELEDVSWPHLRGNDFFLAAIWGLGGNSLNFGEIDVFFCLQLEVINLPA